MAPQTAPISLLLVEDNPGDVRLVSELLRDVPQSRFEMVCAAEASAALNELDSAVFDVALLALSLPDSTGLQALERLRTHTPGLPIVVMTGTDDEGLAIQAVQAGAQDYVVKGSRQGIELARALRYAIERKRSEERLLHQATHDALTGLANRAAFHDRLSLALFRAERSAHGGRLASMAVMLLDLNEFKDVNDRLGHAAGDEVLRHTSRRLQAGVRRADTVARLGGDEFAIILEDLCQPSDSVTVAAKILSSLADPLVIGHWAISVSASIGISLYPDHASNPEQLLHAADRAMYHAKQTLSGFHLYDVARPRPTPH
jgi:diguanylate cyclase (GGDEF)-like protein